MNLNAVNDIVRSRQSIETISGQADGQILQGDDTESAQEFVVDDQEKEWGWLNFRPSCLQWLNTSRWMLVCVCMLTIFQGMAVYTFVQMSLPSLEKRFLLNSKQTGFIISSMDITAMIFGTLISYYGGHSHKGKWLGCGAVLTGFASCLYSLPHFLADTFDPTSVTTGNQPFCLRNSSSTQDHGCQTAQFSSKFYFIFVISQLLSGIGSAPVLTITPAWLDENVHPRHISTYLGIFFTAFVIGPGVGSIIGGKLLEVYVELSQPPGLHLSPRDQRWVGAWWLGPLGVGFFLVLFGLLLLGFPSKLPGSQRLREESIKSGYIIKKNTNIGGTLKDLLPATKLLFTNKTYIFHISGMITGTFAWYGAGPFLYKLIVDRYGTPQFLAGIIMSVTSLLAGNVGLWIGSIVVAVLGLRNSCKKAAKFVFFVNMFTLSILSFLVPGCIYPRYTGVDVPYPNRTLGDGFLTSGCNGGCQCSTSKYMPMCGPGNVNYFSPCYAGCSPHSAKQGFTNCSCVAYPTRTSLLNHTTSIDKILRPGLCKKKCDYSYVYFGFMFIMTIIGVSDSIPSEIVMFRSVPDNQRSYGLGIQFVLSKLMASVPGPIIIGYVIDGTCSLWRTNCGQRGNCLNYDYDKLGWIIVSYAIPLKALSLLLYFLSWYYCKELDHVSDDKEAENADDQGKTTAV